MKLKYHDTGKEKECLPQVGQWNMMNKVLVRFKCHYGYHLQILYVVASQDWPEVTKYAGLVCAQAHRQELIQDLFKTWHDPQRGTVTGGMIRFVSITWQGMVSAKDSFIKCCYTNSMPFARTKLPASCDLCGGSKTPPYKVCSVHPLCLYWYVLLLLLIALRCNMLDLFIPIEAAFRARFYMDPAVSENSTSRSVCQGNESPVKPLPALKEKVKRVIHEAVQGNAVYLCNTYLELPCFRCQNQENTQQSVKHGKGSSGDSCCNVVFVSGNKKTDSKVLIPRSRADLWVVSHQLHLLYSSLSTAMATVRRSRPTPSPPSASASRSSGPPGEATIKILPFTPFHFQMLLVSHDLYGPSSHRCADSVSKHMSAEQSANLFKPLLMPDLPRRVEVVRAQSLKFFSYPGWEKLHDEAMEAESTLMGW
ncbi:hypothetical protein BHE74_00009502 [Ensete ventricosum]|nr:hypothetical protein BHE74_00009502 [Ensete ventricosum]